MKLLWKKRQSGKGRCGDLVQRLVEAFEGRWEVPSAWVDRHVASCPRCQRRLRGAGRLSLAMSLLRCQPHRSDLLMRANSQAIRMLQREVRSSEKAQQLRHQLPKGGLLTAMGRYSQGVTNAAACLAILVLLRVGLLSSIDTFQRQGRQAMHDYYSRNLDEETVDHLL